MNTFIHLLNTQPMVFIHLLSALAALMLGAVLLLARKGRLAHRFMGWTWVTLMATATVTSVFIQGEGMPRLAGYSPIHLLTLTTATFLFLGVRAIRRRQVNAHRQTMTSLYIGACVIAGAFTLLPGRFLGQWLWRDVLGLLA